jgi:hypothetical protein
MQAATAPGVGSRINRESHAKKEIAEEAVCSDGAASYNDRDLLETANLHPDTTGLPMTV